MSESAANAALENSEARPDVPLRAAIASEPFKKRLRFMPGKTSLWSCECVSRSAK
jgi:hypothetical protein